jgi:hypothetical protein
MQRKDNKGQDMKEELIKHVMEEADKCYQDDFPIPKIEFWIREFFDQYQPERSKREDSLTTQLKPGKALDALKKVYDEIEKRDAVL